MIKIKLCGLTRESDIEEANRLKPEYIGFVFARKSRRFVSGEQAAELKKLLAPEIAAVGVFVNETMETVTDLLSRGVIDLAQLHGSEDARYIRDLKERTGKPVIKAFRIAGCKDLRDVQDCPADFILLDSGAGSGEVLDWSLVKEVQRPFFLAGGLSPGNVKDAIRAAAPFAVDVSSGIETEGRKDPKKMEAFVTRVREMEQR